MPKRVMLCFISIVVGAMSANAVQRTNADQPLVFISAFAAGDEGAIHAYKLDPETGRLELVHRTTDVENPFFTALSGLDQRWSSTAP